MSFCYPPPQKQNATACQARFSIEWGPTLLSLLHQFVHYLRAVRLRSPLVYFRLFLGRARLWAGAALWSQCRRCHGGPLLWGPGPEGGGGGPWSCYGVVTWRYQHILVLLTVLVYDWDSHFVPGPVRIPVQPVQREYLSAPRIHCKPFSVIAKNASSKEGELDNVKSIVQKLNTILGNWTLPLLMYSTFCRFIKTWTKQVWI